MALSIMAKPKIKQKKQEVVGEMDLDKIVASPYQMELAAKEKEKEEAKKAARFKAEAMKRMAIPTGK